MAAHKLTARKVTDLRRQYQGGARDVDLAQWFGVTEATVRLHTRDIRRPLVRWGFDVARAKRLHGEGLTGRAIAARLGVTESSISRALRGGRAAA